MPLPVREHAGWRLAAWLLTLCLASRLMAADLTRLTPEDVGVCVEVSNLDRHFNAVLGSPLLNHFEQLDFFADLEISGNVRKLLAIADGLSAQVKLPPEEVRRRLFGGELMLAVWPSLPTGDVLGRGLLMFEASDAELLARLQSSLADAQAGAAPDMEVRQPTHAGQTYVKRQVEHQGVTRSLCFAALDRLAIVTGDETLMQRALELYSQPQDAAGSLATNGAYQASRSHVDPQVPFRAFVQTRSWDDMIREETARLAPSHTLLGAALWEAWQHTDYWLINVNPQRPFRIDSYFACRHAELPPPLSTFAASLRGPCTFFQRVPSDALVALATHGDLHRAHEWLRSGPVREALGAGERGNGPRGEAGRQLQNFANNLFIGLELFEPLLARLGPNLGGYLQARPEAAETSNSGDLLGLQWLLGVQAPEDSRTDMPDLRQNLDEGLRTALRLVANMSGGGRPTASGQPTVTRGDVDGVEVTALEGARALPPGMVAAYALASDYLLAGTSARAVSAAVRADTAMSLAASRRWQDLVGPESEGWGQQLFVDCRALRSMAQQRRQELAQMLSLWRRLSPETASKALDQLLWLIEPLDALAVTARVDEQGISLRLAAEVPAATAKSK